MKKYILVCIIIYAIFSAYVLYEINLGSTYENASASSSVQIMSKVEGKSILLNNYGKWEKTYIKGVDLGAGKPGAFPGDFAITKDEYLKWFNQIVAMNANTIRVYTILSPDFYEALYSYNSEHIKKLYLIQGVWVNENTISAEKDAFAPLIIDQFKKDTMRAIDVIHGNITVSPQRGEASGVYKKDVSKWVIGYILGIEWDGEFVRDTNKLHPEKKGFNGKYLKTFNASPYESFLCEVGDKAVAYETENYNDQRMIAFSNWPVTDPLQHSNEEESVNFAEVNVEHIKATDSFYSGQFASYHVYPYYPDFFNFQAEYLKPFRDGRVNSYEVYINKLNAYHSMPVVISEYGAPSSRGIARLESKNNYNQGNITEARQGEILVELSNIIHNSGCAGGLIFAWQDEWFKRTWNTSDFNIPERRAYWSDYQTNEQSFGLLTFDPGKSKSISYVDGETLEWSQKDEIIKNQDITLSAKSDEKFIYLKINKPGLDLSKDKLVLPIDITNNSGITKSEKYNTTFERPSDFLIIIDGKSDSRLVVHDYYDAFTFNFAKSLFYVDPYSLNLKKDQGDFVNSYLALRFPMHIQATGKISPPSFYNTGLLAYGIANPMDKDFNSKADFYAKGDNLEMRIPWALLNVMDPSNKKIMNDFYKLKAILPTSFDSIYFGIGKVNKVSDNLNSQPIKMAPYTWKSWEEPTYHERLKQSYPMVQELFKNLN